MEQKQNILSSVLTLNEGDDINEMYKRKVNGFVIDFEGAVKKG